MVFLRSHCNWRTALQIAGGLLFFVYTHLQAYLQFLALPERATATTWESRSNVAIAINTTNNDEQRATSAQLEKNPVEYLLIKEELSETLLPMNHTVLHRSGDGMKREKKHDNKTKKHEHKEKGRQKSSKTHHHHRKTNSTQLPVGDEKSFHPHLVQVQAKEAFLWNGHQQRLCRRIKNEFRDKRKEVSSDAMVVGLVAPCDEIHAMGRCGNMVMGFYAMQLAALAHKSTFYFQCTPVDKPYANLFWWLQTNMTRSMLHRIDSTPFDPPLPTQKQVCRGAGSISLEYASGLARNDLRRMSIQLFGARDEASRAFAKTANVIPSTSPLYPNHELDDVAIHFRCGDILSPKIPQNDPNYGMVPFAAYRQQIDLLLRKEMLDIESIGIVTASFQKKHLRNEDAGFEDSCQRIVLELQDSLQSSYPSTRVTIRNDPHDTIPMVYARLIFAKINFCVRSSFCLFPAVASFGTSVVQEGGLAYFMTPISQTKDFDNIRLMNATFQHSYVLARQGLNATIAWLRQEPGGTTTIDTESTTMQ